MRDIFTPARTVSPVGYTDYTQYNIVGLHDDAVCSRVLGHERTCVLVVRTGSQLRVTVLTETELQPNTSKVLSPANWSSVADIEGLKGFLSAELKNYLPSQDRAGLNWEREWRTVSKHLRGPNQCAEVDL